MGLDISLYKTIDIGDAIPETIDNYYILEESPELKIFNKFAFDRSNEYFDLKSSVEVHGKDLSDLIFVGTTYDDDIVFEYTDKDKNEYRFINPSTITKIESCIAVEEIGYQRKGANKQFYDDNMWDSRCVTSINELKEHYEKYFKESGEHFKTTILDKFVEGETFVVYH